MQKFDLSLKCVKRSGRALGSSGVKNCENGHDRKCAQTYYISAEAMPFKFTVP